jgi:hypothetical protein
MFSARLLTAASAALGKPWDIQSAIQLQALGLPYFPWTASALRPSAVQTIINDVFVNRREVMVEFGAGISSLYFAKALSLSGGRLYTIEQDQGWAKHIELLAEACGLTSCLHVIHAPLTRLTHDLGQTLWYDPQVVGKAIPESGVCSVVVDGPVANERGSQFGRHPALRFVQGRLAERASVFLDDIVRPGEKRVFAHWRSQMGQATRVKGYPIRSNLGVLVIGEHYYFLP